MRTRSTTPVPCPPAASIPQPHSLPHQTPPPIAAAASKSENACSTRGGNFEAGAGADGDGLDVTPRGGFAAPRIVCAGGPSGGKGAGRWCGGWRSP
ncbi:hypothetical protein BU16DRAFT_528352 [Lophium mytilinum]|uniref:Uncharacterized protein n=1 Tax=Lophium mytilinum TaxID=390894 RepID=A0A6A6QPW6_9PEZI|nr:hypothetical protein BU16DRAFT_528352 [Lophium mytilinum]